ncbi:hypothetical protein OH77DRAFT_1466556 [Trametes cingulata]|nr:hypothetical protein OH77DRAFT_1466556 [Trametes cingulata]
MLRSSSRIGILAGAVLALALIATISLSTLLNRREALNTYPSTPLHSLLASFQAKKGGYTYKGADYPLLWPLAPLSRVHLSQEDSVHYAVNTPLGRAEWNSTLPSGGHLIHLGPSKQAFTVSMFHEIRCLNIIREVLVAFYEDESADAGYGRRGDVKHCMNYLRQIVLCRADLRLESIRSPVGSKKAVSDVTHECRDWATVYEAAETNYRENMRETEEHHG